MTASFDGGRLSSDGGALLLREADNVFGVTGQLAECFSDHRDPERSEHELVCLFALRVMAIALGYEDLNDHDQLRDDSVLALAVGRGDITGASGCYLTTPLAMSQICNPASPFPSSC